MKLAKRWQRTRRRGPTASVFDRGRDRFGRSAAGAAGVGSLRIDGPRPKAPDVAHPGKLKPAHAVLLRILQRMLVAPVVVVDMIGRDHSAGPVRAAHAVHE